MNPQRSFVRKIIYLVAIAGLLGPLFWLSQPATSDVKGIKGSPGGKLARLRKRYELSQTQLGQIDPASETIKLATLGFRGIATNILWEKANRYKMKKDCTNLAATLNQIIRLEPNFIDVWLHQGWNIAYNVSREFDGYRQRYHWVIKGIDFLIEGTKYNQREPRLAWYIGWVISQKIGRADESRQFRRLFAKDDDFHDALPFDVQHPTRDNWLVGKRWFHKAEEMVDRGADMKGLSPLVFRSDAPMCQMNYAEALENDGTFGEVARRAWMKAAAEWKQYGSLDIPSAYGVPIRLNDLEMHEKNAKQLAEKLDALQPGLREKIIAEKRAALTDQQREAVDRAPSERKAKQHQLAREAEELLETTHQEVARRIKGPRRREALKLAEQAAENEQMATYIRSYRSIIKFEYWRRHAQVEQDNQTITARKLIYQGEQAFADGDLPAAEDLYDRGLAAWRKVHDKFPDLLGDEITGDELMELINRYRRILDDSLPEDFVLQDVIDHHQKP